MSMDEQANISLPARPDVLDSRIEEFRQQNLDTIATQEIHNSTMVIEEQ
ncbi:hypothetical protein J3R73_004584 [Labrys monachus]|uniref:Uncharacterized protein n=1 Tax=Labrys monachus TaxID=217067 RepID=A0ABU0FJL2_9HYPH|nr:hypothetical protein [Labrys monachus]MDQ0394792.1 hypothetical protein [Labrys monachus]